MRIRIGALCCAIAIAAIGLVAAAPGAKAVTVVPCDPTGTTLKNAVATAPSGGTLVLAAGCVYSIVTPATPDDALPVITKALTIVGQGATIQRSPQATANFRIIEVQAPGNLTLTGVTIAKGHTLRDFGGGILVTNTGAALTVKNSTVRDNSAREFGGGITNASGETEVDSTTVSGNTAGQGGGGLATNGGHLTVKTSAVSNNTVDGSCCPGFESDGGGVLGFFGAFTLESVTVSNNTVVGNGVDGFGGGVANLQASSTMSSVTITGNTATDNMGGGGHGGGVANKGTLDVSSTRIESNTVTGNKPTGGGFFNANGTASLRGSPVTNNSAVGPRDQGGGVFRVAGTVDLLSSPVTGNVPDQCGTPSTVPGC